MEREPGRILDEWLVARAQDGSSEAFRQLVERWTPRLRRHAERLLRNADAATDAAQDAWLAIARGLRGLDDAARFPAWAFAICSRRSVDIIRRAVRERAVVAEVATANGVTPAPDVRASADDRLDLTGAIAHLPSIRG